MINTETRSIPVARGLSTVGILLSAPYGVLTGDILLMIIGVIFAACLAFTYP